MNNISIIRKYYIILSNLIIRQDTKKNVLGRWQLDYCNKRLNRKIELSNEDNCGVSLCKKIE